MQTKSIAESSNSNFMPGGYAATAWMRSLSGRDQHTPMVVELEHACLSNGSAWCVQYNGIKFATAEHAIQYMRFAYPKRMSLTWKQRMRQFAARKVRRLIINADTPRRAQEIAAEYQALSIERTQQANAMLVKSILHAKAAQHPYVANVLAGSDDRQLAAPTGANEWDLGPNFMGTLWMQVRAERKYSHVKTDGSVHEIKSVTE